MHETCADDAPAKRPEQGAQATLRTIDFTRRLDATLAPFGGRLLVHGDQTDGMAAIIEGVPDGDSATARIAD